LDKERSFTKTGEYISRISRSHFACCCPHKETWRSTQTNSTRSWYKSCKCTEVNSGIFENIYCL